MDVMKISKKVVVFALIANKAFVYNATFFYIRLLNNALGVNEN